MTTNAMWTRQLLRAAVLVAAASVTGCTTSEQKKPALAGPSEFGQSIAVTVDRDRIPQDGVSRANVVATIYAADGKPITSDRRVTVQWQVSATNGAFVEPSVQQSETDGEGKARMFVTAPAPPAFLPTGNARLVVTARVVGSDFLNTLNLRTVEVQLIPPVGTLPVNKDPVAAFTVVPDIGNINQELTFDASGTTDEGEPCGSQCTYQWDFGDYETDRGQRVTKRFGKAGTFTITLTVTDARGGVDSINRSLKINGPPPPVARFSSTISGSTVSFTADFGATITEYIWDFGDPPGTTVTTTVPATSHTYPTPPPDKSYPVILTVKDSFGQTHTFTSSVAIEEQ